MTDSSREGKKLIVGLSNASRNIGKVQTYPINFNLQK
jgi:hypothetical protein